MYDVCRDTRHRDGLLAHCQVAPRERMRGTQVADYMLEDAQTRGRLRPDAKRLRRRGSSSSRSPGVNRLRNHAPEGDDVGKDDCSRAVMSCPASAIASSPCAGASAGSRAAVAR